MRGDEPAGQVGQHCSGGVGTGDGRAFQGRDDLSGPGGVPPAPVPLELGVDLCPAVLPYHGGGGTGAAGLQDGVMSQVRSDVSS